MADKTSTGPELPQFPIQLLRVDISEIAYKCDGFSVPTQAPVDEFNLTVLVSPFSPESKSVQVGLTFDAPAAQPSSDAERPLAEAEAPKKGISRDYKLKITVHGLFSVVDQSRLPFPLEKIRGWAEKNGAIILMPFLREAVYMISQKTGFQPIMIPMVEVSAFRVGAPNHVSAEVVRRDADATDI